MKDEPLHSKGARSGEALEQLLLKEGVSPDSVQITAAKREIFLRTAFVFLLLVIFAFAVIYSIWIVRCVGYGVMELSDKVLLSLIGATVAEIAGLLYLAGKYLFPSANE